MTSTQDTASCQTPTAVDNSNSNTEHDKDSRMSKTDLSDYWPKLLSTPRTLMSGHQLEARAVGTSPTVTQNMESWLHEGPLAGAAARACNEALAAHTSALRTAQQAVPGSDDYSTYELLSAPGPHRYSHGSHASLGGDQFAVDVTVTRRPAGPRELHSAVDDASEHK